MAKALNLLFANTISRSFVRAGNSCQAIMLACNHGGRIAPTVCCVSRSVYMW